jgi:hypothetical protein
VGDRYIDFAIREIVAPYPSALKGVETITSKKGGE